MALKALPTIARGQNGVGAFILQCKRIELFYCDHWGSSRGMREFLLTKLPEFARNNSQIEFVVSPRPNHHPVIVGHYINGGTKPICARKLSPSEILEKLNLVRLASGEKLKRTVKPVESFNSSVRGIWSPFHNPNLSNNAQ